MNQLDKLREKMKTIDKKLIETIAARVEVARKIGETKKEHGVPLRNWEIEKTVIAHAQECAQAHGISEQLVRSIMQQLIQESRIQQELLHFFAYQGNKEKILLIGGLGDMGTWFSYFFQNQGHEVSIFDVKGKSEEFPSYTTMKQGLHDASFACIATSLEMTPLIIEEITDYGFRGIAFDIASLKGHLHDSISRARHAGVRFTSIHPMFGPSARTLSDKVICFCECGCSEADTKVKGLFKTTAASMVDLSLRDHDRIISLVLGLSHCINVIFIRALMQGGVGYNDLKRVASTTFLAQMVTANSVIKENPCLYYAIQRLNPFRDELYKNIKDTVAHIANIVLEGREEEFINVLSAGQTWMETQ